MEKGTEIVSEERLFAAASHGAAILFGWGIVIPLVIWISQRERSNFVKFHALQAMAFQLTQTLFSIVMAFGLMFVYIVVLMATGFFTIESGSDNMPGLFAGQMLLFAGMFCMMAVYPVVGVIGAALTIAGRDFRYPILGNWLDKYLSRDSETELAKDVTDE